MTISECHGGLLSMYKNKFGNRNNIAGIRIKELRTQITPSLSQRALADQLQLNGIDLDKNAIQRIESGARFITDIELQGFAEVFNITIDEFFIK